MTKTILLAVFISLAFIGRSQLSPCTQTDSLLISYMGSSVAYGTGATNNHGYNYLYFQMLEERFNEGPGLNWKAANISVPGNNTISLGARIDNDLPTQCGKYVIFGLSMGNEGLHEAVDKQIIYDQFGNNMKAFIEKARSWGLIPVVANNYVRGDFTPEDYECIKKMDLDIHQWDVPSINLLGALDNGSGHWVEGYWSDGFHPNDLGHKEFSYAMVPSLFDALAAGVPQPERATGNHLVLNKDHAQLYLKYAPDHTVHSFTVSFAFKTASAGTLASFSSFDKKGKLKIDPVSGFLQYFSPLSGTAKISSSEKINDNNWHTLSFTHFFAKGESSLYIDSVFIGKNTEKLIPTVFCLNDIEGPGLISYKDWFVYRSGMNSEEINAICKGKMLKSSLELYAPLFNNSLDSVKNYAQSTGKIETVIL